MQDNGGCDRLSTVEALVRLEVGVEGVIGMIKDRETSQALYSRTWHTLCGPRRRLDTIC